MKNINQVNYAGGRYYNSFRKEEIFFEQTLRFTDCSCAQVDG